MRGSVITNPSALLIWSLMALERSFTTINAASHSVSRRCSQPLCKRGHKICRPRRFLLPRPLSFRTPRSRWPLRGEGCQSAMISGEYNVTARFFPLHGLCSKNLSKCLSYLRTYICIQTFFYNTKLNVLLSFVLNVRVSFCHVFLKATL